MNIDLGAWSRGGLRARGARLTSPGVNLPKRCDRNALRSVGSDAVTPWPRAGRGRLEWDREVIKVWCAWRSVRATDVTEGAEVE